MTATGREPAASPFEIVLVEPEIPPNTGNIARLCVVTGTSLHLVEPLGFSIDEKAVRRAGLDYWKDCRLRVWQQFAAFRSARSGLRPVFFSTKGNVGLWDFRFEPGDALVFGRETRGLPESLLREAPDRVVRIPMLPQTRSLNLATSAGIVLYEALRQVGWTPG